MTKTDTSAQAQLGYIPAIDGLRAIAVLAVVIFHANAAALTSGYLGVDVFFVISGFVVTYSIAGRTFPSRSEFLRFFYRRRIVRIVPAMAFWILVSALATVLFIPRTLESTGFVVTALSALFGVSNVYLSISSADYFAPTSELNPFTHTWSLGVEEQYYVLFSIFVVAIGSYRRGIEQSATKLWAIALLSLLSLAACMYWSATSQPHAFFMIDSRFWQLGSGMLLALTVTRWRAAGSAVSSAVRSGVAVAALAGLLAAFVLPTSAVPFPQALWPVAVTLILIAALTCGGGPVGRLLESAPATAVGRASYSIYLAHWPIMVLARWTVGLDTPGQQVAGIVASIALGFLSYALVEQPVRTSRWLRSMRPGRVIAGSFVGLGLAALAIGFLYVGSNHVTLSRTGDRAIWSGYTVADVIERDCGVSSRALPGFEGTESVRFDVTACNGETVSAHRMFVAGDSHAGTYQRMLAHFAQDARVPVSIYSKGGCTLFNLKQPNRMRGTECARYADKALAEIRGTAKPGDYLFLPSMRLARIVDMWGHTALPDHPTPQDQAAAFDEARAYLSEIAGRGVHIVLEAPLPVANAPAYRCSDWFNRMNPVCAGGSSTSLSDQSQRRARVMHQLERLATIPGVTIWDPLPILCPVEKCDFDRGGKPVMYDGDHLTGYANDLLAPAFTQFIRTRATR